MLIYNHEQDVFEETPTPNINDIPQGYALVAIKAFGINRADVLQKMGKYPITPDMPKVLGLEFSGEVIGINDNNPNQDDSTHSKQNSIKIGDRVMAIIAGGAYASHVLIPLSQCIIIPQHLSYIEASALPEALFTVWHALFNQANLKNCLEEQISEASKLSNKTIYINAASSGIGTMAIQICFAFGFTVIASTSSIQKLEQLKSMMNAKKHANLHIFCSEEYSLNQICERYNLCIDFCLDMLGDINNLLPNMNKNSRITCIAFLQGAKSSINIASLMQKQITLSGTMLRLQTEAYKSEITAQINQYILPKISSKKIKPIIEQVYAKTNINQAHVDLMSNQHIGKLVVDMNID
jgi:NADPH2:quinone reductase